MAGYRAHAYELIESGGLPESRLGLEILFLLPGDFVDFYSSLFYRALRVDDGSVMHGRSGGLEKAKGTGGSMVLGSQVGAQAKGGGKRWKNTPIAVGDERALKVKDKIDQGLRGLMHEARSDLAHLANPANLSGGAAGAAGEVTPTSLHGLQKLGPKQCRGILSDGVLNIDGKPKKCTMFLKAAWGYCPTCGTKYG